LKDKIVHLVTGGRGGEDYQKLEEELNSRTHEVEKLKKKLSNYKKHDKNDHKNDEKTEKNPATEVLKKVWYKRTY